MRSCVRAATAIARRRTSNTPRSITFAHAEALTPLELPWRYAFRVLTVHDAARTTSIDFITTLSSYLQAFGNDATTWYESASTMRPGVKWGRAFLACLVRELFTLAHNAEAWKAAALIFGEHDGANAAYDECNAQLREQATLPTC